MIVSLLIVQGSCARLEVKLFRQPPSKLNFKTSTAFLNTQ